MHYLKLSTVFAIPIAFGLALGTPPNPAAAQSAGNLKCNGCVSSKDVKNNGLKSKDIKNGQVKNADLGNDAVNGAKIQDGAVSASKLGSDVTALGLSGITSLPAAAFVPNGIDADYSNFLGIAILNANIDDGAFCAAAAVPLPDGAVVNRVEADVSDASAANNLSMILLSYDGLDPLGLAITMATLTSSGSTGTFTTLSTTAITGATVDLAARFYILLTCPPVDTVLTGARVFY